jgi:hypothetical protein
VAESAARARLSCMTPQVGVPWHVLARS